MNELAQLCDRMQIDVWEVVGAAATKPFGFMSFQPGPGLGGHCMPIDPFYLTWKAREYDFYTEFIELAGKVNENMPYWCLAKIARALNDAREGAQGLEGPRSRRRLQVGHRGHARSPALKLIELLRPRARRCPTTTRTCLELPEQGLSSTRSIRPPRTAS